MSEAKKQEPQQDTRQLMTNNQENELSRLLFQGI